MWACKYACVIHVPNVRESAALSWSQTVIAMVKKKARELLFVRHAAGCQKKNTILTGCEVKSTL